jgi:putative alpha-1,2-mannosidase
MPTTHPLAPIVPTHQLDEHQQNLYSLLLAAEQQGALDDQLLADQAGASAAVSSGAFMAEVHQVMHPCVSIMLDLMH